MSVVEVSMTVTYEYDCLVLVIPFYVVYIFGKVL